MTTDLPPAPEGFAWMPVDRLRRSSFDDLAPKMAVATCVDGKWRHRIRRGYSSPGGAARLMRKQRLGETSGPGSWMRYGSGSWRPHDEARRDEMFTQPRPEGDWFVPVRFVPGYWADFGERGLRYLDEGELMPSVVRFFDPSEEGGWDCTAVREGGRCSSGEEYFVEITLPPLPEPSNACAQGEPFAESGDEEAYACELSFADLFEIAARHAQVRRKREAAILAESLDENMAEVGAYDRCGECGAPLDSVRPGKSNPCERCGVDGETQALVDAEARDFVEGLDVEVWPDVDALHAEVRRLKADLQAVRSKASQVLKSNDARAMRRVLRSIAKEGAER